MGYKKLINFVLILLLTFYALPGCSEKTYSYNNIFVTKVIDGDTLELQDQNRVRLIGLDTPEVRFNKKLARDANRLDKDCETIIAMGKRATEFTRKLVLGKQVKLEFDFEKRDRYGRLLAYVYLPDGRMLNAEIIKQGYGQIYTFPPNIKHVDMFIKLQIEARENNRGLWNEKVFIR